MCVRQPHGGQALVPEVSVLQGWSSVQQNKLQVFPPTDNRTKKTEV